MAIIAEGKKIAGEILENLRERVQKLRQGGIEPKLGVILIGDDKPSQTYVKRKSQTAEKIGLSFFNFNSSNPRSLCSPNFK